jgi:SlyX protein
MEDRIVELELRFTEQQRLLQDLSDVVYAQERAVERLRLEVAVLREKLAAEPGLVDGTVNERPPHY